MKSFREITQELNEAKFKAPRGTKELKRDFVKAGGKSFEIVYVQNKKKQVEISSKLLSEVISQGCKRLYKKNMDFSKSNKAL